MKAIALTYDDILYDGILIEDGLIFDARTKAEVCCRRKKVPSKELPAYNL
jgi:hypothetical protein